MRNEIRSIYGENKGYNSIDRAFGRYLMQYIVEALTFLKRIFKNLIRLLA